MSFDIVTFAYAWTAVFLALVVYRVFRMLEIKDRSPQPLTGPKRRGTNRPPPYPQGWFRVADVVDIVAHSEKEAEGGGAFTSRFFGDNLSVVLSENNGKDSTVTMQSSGRVLPSCVSSFGHVYAFYSELPLPAGTEPSWTPLITDPDTELEMHGRSTHLIHAGVTEMPENGADVAHLNELHGEFMFPSGGVLRHDWKATWIPDEDKKHIANVTIQQRVMALNRFALPGTFVDVAITQLGPGLVFLNYDTPVGRFLLIESVTAISPGVTCMHHVMLAKKTAAAGSVSRMLRWPLERLAAKALLRSTIVQVDRDTRIWNWKTYLSRPLVLRDDGPILVFRRWVRQFFKDHPQGYGVDDNMMVLREDEEEEEEEEGWVKA